MDHVESQEFEFLESPVSIKEPFLSNALNYLSENQESDISIQTWSQQCPPKVTEFTSIHGWNQPSPPQSEDSTLIHDWNQQAPPRTEESTSIINQQGPPQAEELNFIQMWNEQELSNAEEFNSIQQRPPQTEELNSLQMWCEQGPQQVQYFDSVHLWNQQNSPNADELNSTQKWIPQDLTKANEFNSIQVWSQGSPNAEQFTSMEVWNQQRTPNSEELVSMKQVPLKAEEGQELGCQPERYNLSAQLSYDEQDTTEYFNPESKSKSLSFESRLQLLNTFKPSMRDLTQYLGTHTGDEPEPHKCNICSKVCKRRRTLFAHHRTHLISHQCFFCCKVFQSTSHLKEHLNIHLDFRPYSCSTCDKGFRSRGDLRKHEKRHLKITKRVNCLFCGKEFKFPREFNYHIRDHVPVERQQCHSCSETFTSMVAFNKHVDVHANSKLDTKDPSENSDAEFLSDKGVEKSNSTPEPSLNKCNFCDAIYKSSRSLAVHLHIHTTLYKCNHCNKTFQCPTHLKHHSQRHVGIKPYKCMSCERTFVSQSDLKKHMQRHLGNRNVTCKTCDKTFMYPGELRQHNRTHLGIKPHKCATCGRTFSIIGDLNRHRKLHSLGLKPTNTDAKCDLLSKPENTTDNCVKSLGEKDKNDPPTIKTMVASGPSFKCDVCSRAFYTSYALNMHLIIHPKRSQ